MTAKTSPAFDFESFRRGYEQGDIDGLLRCMPRSS